MEYKVITVTNLKTFAIEDLEREVKKHIEKGWKPIGGISVLKPYEDDNKLLASQAMIKE